MNLAWVRPSADEIWLACGLFALGSVEVVTEGAPGRARLFVAMALQTLPLVWRRTAPLVATALSLAGVLVELSSGQTVADAAGFLGFVVLCYSVARFGNRAQQLGGAALLLVGVAVHELGTGWSSGWQALVQLVFDVAIGAAAWGAGLAIRRRAARASALLAENDVLVGEWASREQAIVQEERQRIARELHDIIGHALAAISLWAGAAERSANATSPEIRDALAAIRSTSYDAAAEVRRLLGLMRTASDLELSPTPSLTALPALVEHTRTLGLPVELSEIGAARPASAGLQLAAYRIVQEGLTNVAKHATGASAKVELEWEERALVIRVTNDGPRVRQPPSGTGHGLVGARERVELYGGRFTAGPLEEGGFRVGALLPLP